MSSDGKAMASTIQGTLTSDLHYETGQSVHLVVAWSDKRSRGLTSETFLSLASAPLPEDTADLVYTTSGVRGEMVYRVKVNLLG